MRVEEFSQPPLSSALNIIIAELAQPKNVPWATISSRVNNRSLSGPTPKHEDREGFVETVSFIGTICDKFKINTARVNLYCSRETAIGQHENGQLSLQIASRLLPLNVSGVQFAVSHEVGHYVHGDLVNEEMWEAHHLLRGAAVASKSKAELIKLREAARLLQSSELQADAFAVEQLTDRSKALLGARLMLPETPNASRRYMEHPSTALRLRLIKRML